jgi:hypothetical protein
VAAINRRKPGFPQRVGRDAHHTSMTSWHRAGDIIIEGLHHQSIDLSIDLKIKESSAVYSCKIFTRSAPEWQRSADLT